MLYAANRQIFGKWVSSLPSRFVAELPDEHVARSSDLGAYGAGPVQPGLAEMDAGDFARPDIGPRSSGWRRYAESRTIDARPISVETHDHPPGTFRAGERVFHQKFGYGRIRAVNGNKLEIDFEKAGAKKVMDSFVTPA